MGGDPFQMYAAVKLRQGANLDVLTDEEQQILRLLPHRHPDYQGRR